MDQFAHGLEHDKALLEGMQERQVTIEGKTLPLPEPFMVLATQNPIEQEGVYRLPEAQLDRFLFRIHVGYPARDQEIDMLALHSRPAAKPVAITNAEEIVWVQEEPENMGYWDFMRSNIEAAAAGRTVRLIARPRSASPAEGSSSRHSHHQQILVEAALAPTAPKASGRSRGAKPAAEKVAG